MLLNIHEWLNLLVRWAHLITGIMWIGSSFYFMWLDSHLESPKAHKKGVEGELWMVHSGGFYQVEKRLIAPGDVPENLHWFKWEATFTWVTGFMLLCIVYYTTGGIYLVDPAIAKLTSTQGTLIGVGFLIFSWFFYDFLYRLVSNVKAANILGLGFVAVLAYGLTHIFSGRAAYLHVGAMFGTWMVLNVWVHILPNQQKMINATQEGKTPDYNLGKKAKVRSTHNSYMTLPVLFIMLSNHYPSTYSHTLNWLVLLIIIFMGAMVRHVMITKKNMALIPAVISLLVLIGMTATPNSVAKDQHAGEAINGMLAVNAGQVPLIKVTGIIQTRCLSCHSHHPTDDLFKVAPNGIMFDDFSTVVTYMPRIQERVVNLKTMPLGNKTHMTDEERAVIAQWIQNGASL